MRLLPHYLLPIAILIASSLHAAENLKPFFEINPKPILTGFIHLPGLLITSADTAVVIAQKRIKRGDKDPADVVVIRSRDQGRTWSEPTKLFASDGVKDTGYSCVLVEDRKTTPPTLLALYTVGPADWPTSKVLIWYGRRSADDGATWSEPFLIKNDGKNESKPSNGGHGFQFSNGRLVIPGRGNFLTSDDGGTSWTTRGTAESPETKVIPLPVQKGAAGPDSVYLISRKSQNFRVYKNFGDNLATEGDHGSAYPSKGRNPGLELYAREDEPPLLLMSGFPNVVKRKMSITYSTDEGRSWLPGKSFGETGWYSDIGILKDGTILVPFTINHSADLKLARFNLAWLMSK